MNKSEEKKDLQEAADILAELPREAQIATDAFQKGYVLGKRSAAKEVVETSEETYESETG